MAHSEAFTAKDTNLTAKADAFTTSFSTSTVAKFTLLFFVLIFHAVVGLAVFVVPVLLYFCPLLRILRLGTFVVHGDWWAVPSSVVPSLIVVVVGIGVLGIALSLDSFNRIRYWVVGSILHFSPLLRPLGDIVHGNWGVGFTGAISSLAVVVAGIGTLANIVSWIVLG